MKRVLLLIIILALSLKSNASDKNSTQWNTMADGMSQALIKHFWGANFDGYQDRYYFNYGSDMSDMTTAHYWPQAHAMDVIVDGYLRTGNKQYLNLYPLWWIGAPKYNFSGKPTDRWWNVFVDDMEWIALAQIRMWESSGNEEYIVKAKQLYNDWIISTWSSEDELPFRGGITWKTDIAKSKNACSNAPAAIIAARIYRLYDKIKTPDEKPKQAYLDEATKIYEWLRGNLYNDKIGKVSDHMDNDGKIVDWVFTYNQGTFLAAAHQLYKITGNKQYLTDAVKAADYVIEQMSKNNGVLGDATNGDGGLFNGIFFRYFAQLINEPDLDSTTHKRFHDYITRCATVMAENGINKESMLYGGKWWSAPTSTKGVSLTSHLSGCMLMEAMCTLK